MNWAEAEFNGFYINDINDTVKEIVNITVSEDSAFYVNLFFYTGDLTFNENEIWVNWQGLPMWADGGRLVLDVEFLAPVISIHTVDTVKEEGNGGVSVPNIFTFEVRRSADLDGDVTATWRLDFPSERGGSLADFSPGVIFGDDVTYHESDTGVFVTGTVNFAANEVSKLVQFEVVGDTFGEGGTLNVGDVHYENFEVTLIEVSEGSKIDSDFSSAVGTIIDDDDGFLGYISDGFRMPVGYENTVWYEHDTGWNINQNPFGDSVSSTVHPGHTHYHLGEDWNNANDAGAAVYAASNGVVHKIGSHKELGNYVVIKHFINNDGALEEFYSLYAHLQDTPEKKLKFGDYYGIAEGDLVQKSQQIGQVGSTGSADGSHLHFEILSGDIDYYIKNGNYTTYLGGRSGETLLKYGKLWSYTDGVIAPDQDVFIFENINKKGLVTDSIAWYDPQDFVFNHIDVSPPELSVTDALHESIADFESDDQLSTQFPLDDDLIFA